MSGLLEDSVKALRKWWAPAAERAAEKGIDRAVDRAKEWVASDGAALLGGPVVRAAMLDGLDKIKRASPSMAHLTAAEVEGLLDWTFKGYGGDGQVMREFFGVSYEDRRSAMHDVTDAIAALAADRAHAWAEFQAMLKEIGTLALRTLIPLVVAAL